MVPKEIGRAADRLFQVAIPSNWVIRNQQDQEDYGIDYEIEVMLPEDKPSGFLFKVQQKGALQFAEDDRKEHLVCKKLNVDRMRYYLRQIDLPTVLVLVDVTKKCAWWAKLQGNPTAETLFEEAAAACQKTMTMFVPKCNKLPETEQQLLDAMRASQDALTVRCVRETTSPRVLTAALNTDSLDDTVAAFRRHNELLRLAQVEKFLRHGDSSSALRASELIWQSPSESIQVRFAAAVNIIRCAGAQLSGSPNFAEVEAFLQRRLKVTGDLVSLTQRESPAHLHLYAGLLHQTARLSILVDRYMAFVRSDHMQPENGMFAAVTHAGKQHLMALAFREFAKGQDTLAEMVSKGHRSLVPQAWAWLVPEISTLAIILRMDGQSEANARLIGWIDETVGPIAEAAVRAQDWDTVGFCAMAQVGLSDGPDPSCPIGQRMARARELLCRISDLRTRQEHEARLAERVASITEPLPPPTIDRQQDIARYMANALGINLDDSDDPIAQMARLGIEDMNPERVLRNCRYLFVCTGSYGVVGELLGVPTAGMKWVNCSKHRYVMGNLSLDNAYAVFREEYCTKCPDACPHGPEWRWTPEWQQEQDQANLDLIHQCRQVGESDFATDEDPEGSDA